MEEWKNGTLYECLLLFFNRGWLCLVRSSLGAVSPSVTGVYIREVGACLLRLGSNYRVYCVVVCCIVAAMALLI